jgi:hypothetical protein
MTNIWAGIYKEIREPFFEIEDPYTFSEEKKEKEEKGEKKHKEGPEEEKSEKESEDKKADKDYDGDGKVESGKDEYFGSRDKAIKKAMKKEERELYSKSDKNDKIDVRKGIKNKIDVNPKLGEEVKAWVDELIAEGYNLSEFSWDEVYEIYESAQLDEISQKTATRAFAHRATGEFEYDTNPADKTKSGEYKSNVAKERIVKKFGKAAGQHADRAAHAQIFGRSGMPKKPTNEEYMDEVSTYGMPPAGDAQREKPDPLQAAKRRAAQAQVRKELSDLQVAKARSQAKISPASEEAIINYLENRYDLSEGVFDPKKTKLRPASERRASELSPAQKKAAEMKQKRSERLEAEADKVLRQVRGGSAKRSSKPMGSEAPKTKAPAPEANRKLGRQKQDTLAKKASDVLKDVRNK